MAPMDDSDLGGLDLAGAKAYLLDFATAAKMSRKELEGLDAELGLWTRRISLAEGKGMAELAAQARVKLAELESKRAALGAELGETEAKVRRIREKLPMVAARERSIDADRLLAELQMMTGSLLGESEVAPGAGSTLEAQMATLEGGVAADSGLAALKNRLAQDGKS